MASRTSDDLAFEALELIRKKNVKFSIRTGGRQYSCTIAPRDEYEKTKTAAAASAPAAAPATDVTAKATH